MSANVQNLARYFRSVRSSLRISEVTASSFRTVATNLSSAARRRAAADGRAVNQRIAGFHIADRIGITVADVGARVT